MVGDSDGGGLLRHPGWVVLGSLAAVAAVVIALWPLVMPGDELASDVSDSPTVEALENGGAAAPTAGADSSSTESDGSTSSSAGEGDHPATPLESSLLVGNESNNLNWSVVDLTPDVAAFGVDGEATSVRGVAFRLGGYSAQTQRPIVEAEFNLGRDYSVLRAVVGLTDNSEEDDPVQVEVVNAVTDEELFSGTVSVGSPQLLELSVVDILRVRVTITGGTQFSSSWLTFSEPS